MFVFSEDPPLKSKGHGLCVLLYNLFAGSGVDIERWFTFLSVPGIEVSDIDSKMVKAFKIIRLKSFPSFNSSAKLNHLLFFWFFPSMVRLMRKDPDQPLFIPVGSSAFVLLKIWMFQLFLSNPIWIYVVDDLEEISMRQNRFMEKMLCKLFLRRCLKGANKNFAITSKLADKLDKLSGRKTGVILPCFQKVDPIRKVASSTPNQPQVTYIFTGGLNFLYDDALKTFSMFLNRRQQETGSASRLIIQTYSPRSEFDRIGFSGNVEYRTSKNREDLYKTYEEADAFIVPYSFSNDVRPVVSTSFPQKIAQIIQFGIPIIVFGPSYGSVVDFFARKGLNYVIDVLDYGAFNRVVQRLMEGHAEEDTRLYLEAYEAHFSQQACLKQLFSHTE